MGLSLGQPHTLLTFFYDTTPGPRLILTTGAMSTSECYTGSNATTFDTILVTGGCGFLGSHIVEVFAADPRNKVVAVSRNPTRFLVPQATYLTCDVNNHSDVEALVMSVKPKIIVHTVTPGPFEHWKYQYRDYLATKNLVKIAVKSPYVQVLIYTGSTAAVANASGLRSDGLTEAESVLHTLESGPSANARTKSASETLVRNANTGDSGFNKQNDDFTNVLRTAVLRVPGIYGPRDTLGIPNLLKAVNTFVTRIQFGDDKTLHDWIYVESCAYAHLLVARALMESDRSVDMRVDGEAFHITDGKPMNFWKYSRRIWTYAGDKNCTQPEKLIKLPWWPMIALATAIEWLCFLFTFGQMNPPLSRERIAYIKEGGWFDIEKARMRLGYSPLVDTNEGIRRTVLWFQRQTRTNTSEGNRKGKQ